MSRDFFILSVPTDDLNMGNNYADMRMEMYRNRGGFSLTKRGSLEIRTFAADQYDKYMEKLNRTFELNKYLTDPKFEAFGFRKPEDLIYIDGKPAYEFVRGLGYSEKELKEYPQIVKAEIASAMTGGRNHVDLAVPSINKNGEYEMKAQELRADVSDLNGKEGWASSSREKRMESLYQSKNRDSRLREINKAMGLKMKKINSIKLLSERILYNAGLEEENIRDPKGFIHEKAYALNKALEVIKEGENGNPIEEVNINDEYLNKKRSAYLQYVKKADAFAAEKIGKTDEIRLENAWITVGEENAQIDCIARQDSRGCSALAYAFYNNPQLNPNELIKDKAKFGQAIWDYYKYLEKNPTKGEGISPEQRAERYKQQANQFKAFRKMQMDIFPRFDIYNKEERIKRMEATRLLRDLSINCVQNEDQLAKLDEYADEYGGKEKLQQDRECMFVIAPFINALSVVDDTAKPLDQRAGALHFIRKYGAFFQRINNDNIHEIAKLGISNALSVSEFVHEQSFENFSEEELKRFMNGGTLKIDEKNIQRELNIGAKETNGKTLRSVKELIAAVDKIDQKLAKDKADASRKKTNMADLADKKDRKVPDRKRANEPKTKAVKYVQKSDMDPLKKK